MHFQYPQFIRKIVFNGLLASYKLLEIAITIKLFLRLLGIDFPSIIPRISEFFIKKDFLLKKRQVFNYSLQLMLLLVLRMIYFTINAMA